MRGEKQLTTVHDNENKITKFHQNWRMINFAEEALEIKTGNEIKVP